MEIETEQKPAEPVAPVVQQADPNVVANLVMSKLFQAGQSTQEQRDAVGDIVKTLQAGNFDPGFIEGIALTSARIDKEVESKIQGAVRQYSENQKQQKAQDIVRDVIEQYGDADELIAEASDSIFNKVIKRFNTDPALGALRSDFEQGFVDRRELARIAKEQVLAFYKKAGKDGPTQKGPAMKPAASSSNTSSPSPDPTVADLSGEALNRYESMKALALRSGVSAEEAEKKALAGAKRFMN